MRLQSKQRVLPALYKNCGKDFISVLEKYIKDQQNGALKRVFCQGRGGIPPPANDGHWTLNTKYIAFRWIFRRHQLLAVYFNLWYKKIQWRK
jgi:hypothetical protein